MKLSDMEFCILNQDLTKYPKVKLCNKNRIHFKSSIMSVIIPHFFPKVKVRYFQRNILLKIKIHKLSQRRHIISCWPFLVAPKLKRYGNPQFLYYWINPPSFSFVCPNLFVSEWLKKFLYKRWIYINSNFLLEISMSTSLNNFRIYAFFAVSIYI